MVDTMIRLHSDTSTNFDAVGLCVLPDAMKCEVVEERNGVFELEMTYSVEGRSYSELMLRRMLVAKPNPFDDPQPFRIYEMSKPLNGIVTVKAEHISYDLSGYSDKPFTAGNVVQAMTKMKSESVVACPFTFSTDKSTSVTMTVDKPTSIRSLLGGTQGSVLDTYGGGEYEFNRYNVKLWSARGQNRGVSIRYGKNLTSLEQEENCANVYSHIFPYYYSDENGLVTVSGYTVAVPGTHNYTKILPVDLSDKFEDPPTQAMLRVEANNYISNNNLESPKVSLKVSFVQLAQSEEYKNYALLETVHLCDTVNVEFPKLGVSSTAKCIKTVYNVLTGKYTSIELGDARTNLATTMANQSDNIAEEVTESSIFKQAVDHATKLITGGLGGYVVLHSSSGGNTPDEILIMDQPTIESATNVWRWNKNGLGHSKTGYNGSFGLAMTADGQIVASRITTGTLDASKISVIHLSASSIDAGTMSAARIKGGTLSLGGTSAGTGGNGVLEVYNSSNQRVGRWDSGSLYVGNIVSNLNSPNFKLTANGDLTTKSATLSNSIKLVSTNGGRISLQELIVYNTGGGVSETKPSLILQSSSTSNTKPYARVTNDEVELRSNNSTWTYYAQYSSSKISLVRPYASNSGISEFDVSTSDRHVYVGSDEDSANYYVSIAGRFYVTQTKSRLVSTKDYAKRLLYCYETPSPMFGDVGEGVISEDGKCYVWIDSILAETITLSQYQVLLQSYGFGDCVVTKRYSSYFVVEGTPGLSFGWEIKAKQSDFDQLRLDKPEEFKAIDNAYDYASLLNEHIDYIHEERRYEVA